MKSVGSKDILKGFFSLKGSTPEESELLEYCKRVQIFPFKTFSAQEEILSCTPEQALALLLSTIVKFFYVKMILEYFRRAFPFWFKVLGVGMGVVCGGIYGVISSTAVNLAVLEKLGPEYPIGKMVLTEIDEFSMKNKAR
jgi:hypothetical protein